MPISQDSQLYLASVVSAETKIPVADATTRVNDVIAQMTTAQEKLVKTADRARRIGILAAFLTAATLLVGAAAAYWASCMGGHHRDSGAVFEYFNARRRPIPAKR